MKYLTLFFLTISTVSSFHIPSRDCFEHGEMDCMENFVDKVFYSKGEVNECSELQKFVQCSTDVADECFGDERNQEVEKGIEELENLCKDTCGEVASGDNSDFDEETYSHIQLTATIKKKKKRPSHSTTDKEISVSTDSKKCFTERKKICWDTFENAVIYSVFYSSTGLDKCSVLRHFIICARQAAGDCFENKRDEYVDELLEVWESKSNEFCEVDIPDGKSVPSNIRPIDVDQNCAVTGWSEWSPCSVTCGNGYKARTRHYVSITSLRNLFICDARGIEMEQENPCSVDCTVNFTQPETIHRVLSDSEKCFEDMGKNCTNTALKNIFYDFFSLSENTEKCSQLQKLLNCTRQASEECFKDDHGEEVDEVLENFGNQYYKLCEGSLRKDGESISALLMNMFTTDYQKRETCLYENKSYIFDCVSRAMWVQDDHACSMWEDMVRCMKDRIGQKCDEKVVWRFEERVPAIPEHIQMICRSTLPAFFDSPPIDYYIDYYIVA